MAIYTNSYGRSGPEIDELLEKAGTAVQSADGIMSLFTVDTRVPIGATLVVLPDHTVGAYDAVNGETYNIKADGSLTVIADAGGGASGGE